MKVAQVDGTTCSKPGNKQEQGKEVQTTKGWGTGESREEAIAENFPHKLRIQEIQKKHKKVFCHCCCCCCFD